MFGRARFWKTPYSTETAVEVQDGGGLVRGLGAYQILFITIGGTVGLGFATTSGEVLAISGPGGVLIAFGVMGLVAIAVMEGICEMIVLWPISNAMIEFVRAFVDRDLAIVVGIAYWYTYAVTLAALIIGSAELLSYWPISFPLLNVTFALFLLVIFVINSRGIKVFGWIELFGGIIKVLLVLAIFIIMICINYGSIGDAGNLGSTLFNDGVRDNPNVADTHFKAVLVSIPLAIFSYIGVELITVTAFEASRPGSLKGPAKYIAYIVLAIYLISIGGFVANIEWINQNLPQFFGQALVDINDTDLLGRSPFTWNHPSSRSYAAPVIAVLQVGIAALPGVLTGFLVYSGLSAANTALYVASRTLYGLTRDLNQMDNNAFVRFFAKLNTVSPTTRIPVWALVVSWLIFAGWLPFVHLKSGYTQHETLVAIGSVGCVLVWASQCLAFIRYNKWLSKHRLQLTGENMGRFQRWPRKGFSSFAASIQPVPAYVGLVSCLVIVFVLNSVSMWNGDQLEFKALTVYLGPGILLLIFVCLKIYNRGRGWVKLGDWEALRATLTTLNSLIEGDSNATPPRTPPNVDLPNPASLYANAVSQDPNLYPPAAPSPAHISGDTLPSGNFPHGHGGLYPNHQNARGISPASPAAGGIMMPPTAAQIEAQNQIHTPHHQHSERDLRSPSLSPYPSGHSQFPGVQDYELSGLSGSGSGSVSPATELYGEGIPAAMYDEHRQFGPGI